MPLERCPACGSEVKLYETIIQCRNDDCMVSGPLRDPAGDKWNTMCRGIAAKSDPIPCTSDNTHVGAVVKLNSGGPEMTVADIDDADVRCAINTEHYWDTGRFPIACLTLVRPAPTTAPAEVKP